MKLSSPSPSSPSSSSICDRHGYINILEEPFTSVLFERRKGVEGAASSVMELKGCSFNNLLRGLFTICCSDFSKSSGSSSSKYKDLLEELPGHYSCWIAHLESILMTIFTIATTEEIMGRVTTLLRMLIDKGHRDSSDNSTSTSASTNLSHILQGAISFLHYWMTNFHIYMNDTEIMKIRQCLDEVAKLCNILSTINTTENEEIVQKCNNLSSFVDKLLIFYSKLIKGIRIKGVSFEESSTLTYPYTIQSISTSISLLDEPSVYTSQNFKKQNIERLSQIQNSSNISIFGGISILNMDDDSEDDVNHLTITNHNDKTSPVPILAQGFLCTIDPLTQSVWDYNIQELARQWTILDHEAFCSIPLDSFISVKVPLWTHPRVKGKASKLRNFIDRFNAMTLWTTASVLNGVTPGTRAVTYSALIDLCSYFKLLRNYNGLMAVITGLKQSSITRLSDTISLVSKKRIETFQRLDKLMSGSKNYSNYRTKLESHFSEFLKNENTRETITRETISSSRESFQNAIVPHLGSHLAEISSIMDGNQDYSIDHSNFINLDKKKLLYSCISKLTLIRNQRYNLQTIRIIQNVINRSIMKYTFFNTADMEIEMKKLHELSLSQEGFKVEEVAYSNDEDKSNEENYFIDDISEDLFDDQDFKSKKSESVSKSLKKTYNKLTALLRIRSK